MQDVREEILSRLSQISGIHPKSGLSYSLVYFANISKLGIKLSKRSVKKEMGCESPFIHSWSTFARYLGVVKEFINFAKNKNVRRLDKLTFEIVYEFLALKSAKCSKSTIKINMCSLEKFFNAVNRHDLKDRLSECFQDIKCTASKCGNSIKSFDNPTGLLNKIEASSPLSSIVARIQYITGARIHEVRSNVSISGTDVIIKGKGGKVRTLDFSHRLDDLRELGSLQDELKVHSKGVNWKKYFQMRGSTYHNKVRQACRSMQDEYNGAHGLRANYAQNLEKKLEQQVLTDVEIEKIITRELGHERIKMARHYLRV
ncbi:MAG: hypothetical protein QM235_14305 [Pseudomonadota bacterium]|nr:hypothetical protein [Pseudomonadota bacterium]